MVTLLCVLAGCRSSEAPRPANPRARTTGNDVLIASRAHTIAGGYKFAGTGSPSELHARSEVDRSRTYCARLHPRGQALRFGVGSRQ